MNSVSFAFDELCVIHALEIRGPNKVVQFFLKVTHKFGRLHLYGFVFKMVSKQVSK